MSGSSGRDGPGASERNRIRAFVAVRLADSVLASIAAFQEELRATDADVRWVPPENMHLTLQFLGSVPEDEVAGIVRALEAAFAAQAPLDVECRRTGAFPSLRRPRVLWVGLHGDGLAALAERTETALVPLGFPPAERELRPHVTLGRVRTPRAFEPVAARMREEGERSFGTSHIDHAALYRSRLHPRGAVYEPLATFAFGAVND